jgi:hypothetical protein
MKDLGLEEQSKQEPKTRYTKEELDRAEREAKERVKLVAKKLGEKPRSYLYMKDRLATWWFTWLPWLLLPFFLSTRSTWSDIIALGIPSLATLFGFIHPYELVCVCLAFYAGFSLKHIFLGRTRTVV